MTKLIARPDTIREAIAAVNRNIKTLQSTSVWAAGAGSKNNLIEQNYRILRELKTLLKTNGRA